MKEGSLSKRQRQYRRVLEAARQTRVSSARLQEAFEELKRKMAENPYFFGTLAPLNDRPVPVRVFEHKGVRLAVKNCGSYRHGSDRPKLEGADIENYAKFVKFHKQAVKTGLIKPAKYVLTALPSVGVFEAGGFWGREVVPHTFVAMKVLSTYTGEPFVRETGRAGAAKKRVQAAIRELERDSQIVAAHFGVLAPQAVDSLVLGNLRPARFFPGRWALALPHDYR